MKYEQNNIESTRRVRVELGRRMIDMDELAGMEGGRVLDLDCDCDENVDIYMDGHWAGRGEALVVDGKLAVRVQELLTRETIPARMK